MAVHDITLKELPAAYRILAQRLPQEGAKACVMAAVKGHRLMVERTTTAKPFPAVDRGAFRRRWKVEPLPDGAAIVNDSPYAAVIDLGRRPGRKGPPLAPILEWVIRKYDALKGKGPMKGAPRSLEVLLKRGEHKAGSAASIWKASGYRAMLNDARRIAWAIQRKIHLKGTEPRNIMNSPVAQSAILGYLKAAIEKVFGEV